MPVRSTTARWRSIAAGCSAWCRRCICPTTANSTSRGISSWATAWWAARSPSAGTTAPFGTDLLFAAEDVPGLVVHAEICEDIWIPVPPSSEAALAGATVLANLSASNITIGKAETRRLLCASQSARCVAAYLYAAAGAGESTTDLAWDGQASIFENGATLAETERFPSASQFAIGRHRPRPAAPRAHADGQLRHQPPAPSRWRSAASRSGSIRQPAISACERKIERYPFVPADAARLEQDCYEAYNIQVSGLAQRLRATGIKRVVIGVSGGLDSTQALIVCGRALDLLGLPRANILAYTMPGFATSAHTKANAIRLMQSLGVTWQELDIRPAAQRMLADIGHPFSQGEPVYDLTFENVQAGLRTDYLFRLANHHNGIVIGTGDLSELALGWCTYGVGDQMSHYNVNAGVPKTLIQHLIRWVISSQPVRGGCRRRRWTRSSPPRSRPSWCRRRKARRRRAPRRISAPTRCRTSTSTTRCATASVPSKIAFLALHAWGDAAKGEWPPGFPPERRGAYDLRDDPPLAGGVPAPLLRVQPVQALGHAERAEGERGRLAVAARRLARAVRRQRQRLARRAGAQRSARSNYRALKRFRAVRLAVRHLYARPDRLGAERRGSWPRCSLRGVCLLWR